MTDSNIHHYAENNTEVEAELMQRKVPWGLHAVVTVAILVLSLVVVKIMFATKPEARKFDERPAPSVAVEVTSLQPTNYNVWVESYGSVEALTETQLVSDVNGRVIEVSPNIRAGASFNAGDVLLRIDPRDYRIEVDVAESAVADADVKYQQELAQANIAERDWNVRPGNEQGKALALRLPQVAAAKAALEAAKAKLAKAQLNLERTQVKAPFDGKVKRQMVDLGQVVNPSQAIAEIYSTDLVEVRLPVKAHDLAHLQLPDEQENRSVRPKVVFEGEMGNKTYYWNGELVRSEGAYDTSTRMLYVVAQIVDPFKATSDSPSLRIGQFLRAKIEGKELANVFVIPRRAVSQNYMISIEQEGILKKMSIDPIWTDTKSVVVSAGGLDSTSGVKSLSASDTLILTPTANLPEGTRVKRINEDARVSRMAKGVEDTQGKAKKRMTKPVATVSDSGQE